MPAELMPNGAEPIPGPVESYYQAPISTTQPGGQCDPNSQQCQQILMSGVLIAAVIGIFITLAYRRWRGSAKRILPDGAQEDHKEISVNNKTAMIFAGAIALCALAYFATHIYIPCGMNNSRICNSVTGSSEDNRY
jgi:hypothetical protein